jgi:hypothetical protein
MGPVSMDIDNDFTNEECPWPSRALDLGTGGLNVHKCTQSDYTYVWILDTV